MELISRLFPAIATAILHVILISAVTIVLPEKTRLRQPPALLTVTLLQESRPALQAPVQTPSVAPMAAEKKQRKPKPRIERKPVAPPREAAKQALPLQTPVPNVTSDVQPDKSSANAIPAAPAPASPTPEPPAKTSASVASYAASNRKPPYPRLSRSNDEQGTVILRVLVKENGTAGTVELKRSSGYPLLDESALNTVRGWRFNPATVDGKPVAEWYQLAIPFTLEDN